MLKRSATNHAIATLVFGGFALVAGCHRGSDDDGRNQQQRELAAKTDKDAKQGALKKQPTPTEDLEQQCANLDRLAVNARENRENGNRIAAWAAERDAKHVEKLIAQDRARIEAGEGETKTHDAHGKPLRGGGRDNDESASQ